MPHTMLRFPTVKARTGLSRSTIYLRISRGTFPAPVSLGGRAVGWIEAADGRLPSRRQERRGRSGGRLPGAGTHTPFPGERASHDTQHQSGR